MTGRYAYTPYVWAMLAPAALLLPLSVYAWRRRSAPGARPFVVLVAFIVLWAAGAALELSAVAPETESAWFVFKSLWKLPVATASLVFALEYADLGRFLGRGALALLSIPPAVPFVLRLFGSSARQAGGIDSLLGGRSFSTLGPIGLVLTAWGFALVLASSLVFLWLVVRSPLYRWPAALCLCGHVATRLGFLVEMSGTSPVAPMDATILGATFAAVMYAVALGPFRMLELLPVARWTLVDQMPDGVVVLDARERVADLNPAAAAILGSTAERARGLAARDLLPALPDAGEGPGDVEAAPSELVIGEGPAARAYAVRLSPLQHRGGFRLGTLVVLHDVTESRRGTARVLEQQRALATLRERDLLARELHDSLGQVLGFAKLQAQAARELLARGDGGAADAHLERLVSVAQDAHTDVREFLLGARLGSASEAGFIPALEDYVRRFQSASGLATTVEVSPAFPGGTFEPMAGTQLLRIIQEALTNVRKHARARAVSVGLSVSRGNALAVVRDDGDGFDPAGRAAGESSTYGLRFMRERAEELGGEVRVDSAPGGGTRVAITVPLHGRPS